jgi:hypothetical protein
LLFENISYDNVGCTIVNTAAHHIVLGFAAGLSFETLPGMGVRELCHGGRQD